MLTVAVADLHRGCVMCIWLLSQHNLELSIYWWPTRTWALQRTHYWTPNIQDGGDRCDVIFLSRVVQFG